mgnify:FL=1
MSFMSFVNFSQFNSDFYEFRIVYEYIIGRFPRFITLQTTWADLNISAIVSAWHMLWGILDICDLSGFFLILPDDLYLFKDMQSTLRVHLQQTLCEYIVWALMLLYRQKSGSKIILTKWFYF